MHSQKNELLCIAMLMAGRGNTNVLPGNFKAWACPVLIYLFLLFAKSLHDSSSWMYSTGSYPLCRGTFLAHVAYTVLLLYMHVCNWPKVVWSCPRDCKDPFCKNRCLHCHCMQTFQLQLVCRIVWGWSAGLCLLTQVSWLVIKRGPDTLARQTMCWCSSLFLWHFVCYNKPSLTLTVKHFTFGMKILLLCG